MEDTKKFAKETATQIWSKVKEMGYGANTDGVDGVEQGDDEEEDEEDEEEVEEPKGQPLQQREEKVVADEQEEEEEEEEIHLYSDEFENDDHSLSILDSSQYQ